MAEASQGAWRCLVCGYIHRGTEPPEWCPVCGAASADFEPFTEEKPAPAEPPAGRWRCAICGYDHEGPEPPGICPICGATTDQFEAVSEEQKPLAEVGGGVKIVVVGGGIAGVSAVEAIRDASPRAEVTFLSREASLPYYRLNLTRYLAGEVTDDELPIHPESWYADRRIDVKLDVEVSGLSLDTHSVEVRDGAPVQFEKLILTTGAHPFIPPIPGAGRKGITSLRTASDAKRIRDSVQKGMSCVCIGGGILGLETAGALARSGASVTLLEGFGWLMPRQLNQRAAERLAEHAAGLGVNLVSSARTSELVGNDHVAGVVLENGKTFPADMVIITTGVRPNSHLARRAGLQVNKGIVVDDHLVSSHPHILAAGDVAEHRGVLYGNWTAAQYQGSIAGMNAAGRQTEFGGIPRANTLKVLGIDMFSIGVVDPDDGSYREIEEDSSAGYCRFLFRDSRLVGAILLGDTTATGAVKNAIEGKSDLSELLQTRPTGVQVAEYLLEHPG